MADAALNTKVEKFEQRSCEGLRNYYYALGIDYRKALAAGTEGHSTDFAATIRECRDRLSVILEAVESAQSVDAVDPSATNPGTPTPRD